MSTCLHSDEFPVVLSAPVPSEPRMRPGDTLVMRPLRKPTPCGYLVVLAEDGAGREFLTDYDPAAFARQGWAVAAYVEQWVPQAATRVLAVVPPHLLHRHRAEQGAA